MITLRDLLFDLITQAREEDTDAEELVDEYIALIIKRLIGGE